MAKNTHEHGMGLFTQLTCERIRQHAQAALWHASYQPDGVAPAADRAYQSFSNVDSAPVLCLESGMPLPD